MADADATKEEAAPPAKRQKMVGTPTAFSGDAVERGEQGYLAKDATVAREATGSEADAASDRGKREADAETEAAAGGANAAEGAAKPTERVEGSAVAEEAVEAAPVARLEAQRTAVSASASDAKEEDALKRATLDPEAAKEASETNRAAGDGEASGAAEMKGETSLEPPAAAAADPAAASENEASDAALGEAEPVAEADADADVKARAAKGAAGKTETTTVTLPNNRATDAKGEAPVEAAQESSRGGLEQAAAKAHGSSLEAPAANGATSFLGADGDAAMDIEAAATDTGSKSNGHAPAASDVGGAAQPEAPPATNGEGKANGDDQGNGNSNAMVNGDASDKGNDAAKKANGGTNGHASGDAESEVAPVVNGGAAAAAIDAAGAAVSSAAATVVPEVEREAERLWVKIVTNDGTDENMITLIHLKTIFSKQLPKMPRRYIVRLVFDRKHYSIALFKGTRVVGGICYRPVFEQAIAEIAFCAITATEQVKGLGTRLMNELKNHVKTEGLRYFLTYADNYAIGYFKKQGFSKTVSLPRDRWFGYIKDYDGGTLMECYIHPTIDYTRIPQMIEMQKAFILERIRERSLEHIEYPGLGSENDAVFARIENPLDIPGVKEAGWTAETIGSGVDLGRRRDSERDRSGLQTTLRELLQRVKTHEDAEIFADPIDTVAYPEYLTVCSDPIDLSTIGARLQEKPVYYRSREMLFADLMRMVENCKSFNPEGHDFHMRALKMEMHILEIFNSDRR